MEKIFFERPIIFFDIEGTGLNPQEDRIVELCMIKIVGFQSLDEIHEVKTVRMNPGIPISPDAQEVHGISNDDVKDCHTFAQYSKGILQFIRGCDICGFNSNRYDIPMLEAEFRRAGLTWNWRNASLIDVGNMFKILRPRTLEAAYIEFTGKSIENAHAAEDDVRATVEVLRCMLDVEPIEAKDVSALAKYSNYDNEVADLAGKFKFAEIDGKQVAVFNFTDRRGQPMTQDEGFLEWMLSKDFPIDTKAFIRKQMNW